MVTGLKREECPALHYPAHCLSQKHLNNLNKILLLVTSASAIRLEVGIAKTKYPAYFGL